MKVGSRAKKKIKIRKDHSQISVENGVGVYPSLKISEIFYGNVNGSRFHKHSRGGQFPFEISGKVF